MACEPQVAAEPRLAGFPLTKDRYGLLIGPSRFVFFERQMQEHDALSVSQLIKYLRGRRRVRIAHPEVDDAQLLIGDALLALRNMEARLLQA